MGNRRGAWKTQFGIYLAAIGSAFGLGSLWRFPYIVAENGGGAFVILYVFLVVLIGVPLLVGELLVGKITRRSVVGAQKQLVAQVKSAAPGEAVQRPLVKLMPIAGWTALAVCLLILGYYSVISGWVLYHLGLFIAKPFTNLGFDSFGDGLSYLRSSGSLQIGLTVLHLLIITTVAVKGVEDGLERWVGVTMPIFVGILSVLIFKSLSLSSSSEALRYFLYPDFSRLSISSMAYAVGHLCFTLSVGFSTMVTFGSYLQDEANVPRTGFRVATMDSLTAVIAGLLIFPLVGGGMENATPELLFEAVPEFLSEIRGGNIFGIFFFLCLYLAALGSSISLLETVVANLTESLFFTRAKAALIGVACSFFAAILPALSSNLFGDFQYRGKGVLELIDWGLINWIVPVLALFIALVVSREINDKLKRDEFIRENAPTERLLYKHWRILMKWIVPAMIIYALLLQVVGLFIES